MPVFGTCAGAIVLADRVSDGERTLGVWDMQVERNAYGRQSESFEADIEVWGLDEAVRGIFIRAPIITDAVGTTVMATYRDQPVLVRKDNLLAATFHPELRVRPGSTAGLSRIFAQGRSKACRATRNGQPPNTRRRSRTSGGESCSPRPSA